eukprot:3081695-Amphidinium_carterae.1
MVCSEFCFLGGWGWMEAVQRGGTATAEKSCCRYLSVYFGWFGKLILDIAWNIEKKMRLWRFLFLSASSTFQCSGGQTAELSQRVAAAGRCEHRAPIEMP